MKRIILLPFLMLSTWIMAQSPMNVIKTDAGLLSGSMNADQSVNVYKGIPFAAPPLGNLRWQAPQPVKPWEGVKACTAYSPMPVQGKPNEFGVYTREFLIKDEPLSEDCLYLNVWSGAKTPSEKRPVMVWIYGGGFGSGGTNVPIYDGEALAKKGVILVSVNYRVGVLGFLAHPELSAESPNHASGNYGLMDQLAGLKWVQNNIAAFGGDPGNVTIAGQSAGSMSVNYLVASPLGKGLFKRAIAESGATFLAGPFGGTALKQAEEEGLKTAARLGAKSLADLRKLSPDELLKQNTGRPIIDGYVVTEPVATTFAAGKENKVALLTGWNTDDAFVGQPKSAVAYTADIAHRYPTSKLAFLKFYPGTTDAEAERSQTNSARDQTFGAQNYTWASVQSTKGKVYLYRFTRRMPARPEFKKYGAFHTAEVAYVFNNLKFLNRPLEPVDLQLANQISAYWVNFVKTGNPNGKGLPVWPAYHTTSNQVMMLGDKLAAVTLPDKAALDFMVKQMSVQ